MIFALSDEQVLVLTELQMEPEQDARLSKLRDRQQSGTLSEGDRTAIYLSDWVPFNLQPS